MTQEYQTSLLQQINKLKEAVTDGRPVKVMMSHEKLLLVLAEAVTAMLMDQPTSKT